jgi:hypothetical protein
MSYPNCNPVLNCVGSPRRFSSRDSKMENALSYWNWPENPIMTLFSTDGALLKVLNRKEGCRAWNLIATTSHVRTFSMLFSKTRQTRALTYLFQALAIRPGLGCVSPTSVEYNPCFLLSSSYIPEVLHLILPLPPPQPRYRYCPPCTQPCSFGRLSEVVFKHVLNSSLSRSSHTNGGCHPLTLEFEQEYHVNFTDLSTEGESTWRTKSFLRVNYSTISCSLINNIIRCFLNFPLFHNLRMRFILRGRVVTSHVLKTLKHFH